MNLTIEVLQIIGSPFASETKVPQESEMLQEAYECSKKNKMSLLFLQAVKNDARHPNFELYYEKEIDKYQQMLRTVSRVSGLLADNKIDHAVFKTVRPYKSATVDVDVLVFEGKNTYIKSVEIMQRAGYKLIMHGPRSTTLLDQKTSIGIDVYEEIAVSFTNYIQKENMIEYVRTTRLPTGEYVRTLSPEADLASIIAHSLIKEQMYTLSEYYTFVHYLKQMKMENLVRLTEQNHISSALKTHATITGLLHKVAHNTVPNGIQQILNSFGEDRFETIRLIKNRFETPHKYHPITLAKSLLEITKGKETRKSMATQLLQMLRPKLTKEFTKRFIDHFTRETY